MISMFRKFFKSFMARPDLWFFYIFLATGTLSVRKVLFYYSIGDSFNEYTGIYLYLSDIFLFLTLTTWLLLLYNNYLSLSNLSPFLLIKKLYQQVIHRYILFFPLFMAIFSFLSILWATNESIAFFRSIKLLGFILMFFYVFQNVPRGTFLKKSFQIIITLGIIQSIIGIIQFFIQHSIGLEWLKESIIAQNIPGVAKILLNGHAYIRSYALFPHPNIFGGFLVFSILSSILYFKMFHVEHFKKIFNYKKHVSKKFSQNILPVRNSLYQNIAQKNYQISQNVPRGTFSKDFVASGRRTFWENIQINWYWHIPLIIAIVLLIQILALLLTFSKSAIIGLFIGFSYLYWLKCSTWNINIHFKLSKMFHVEHFWRKFLLTASIIILFFLIFKPDMYSLFLKSLQERVFYLNTSPDYLAIQNIIGAHWTLSDIKTLAFGIGSGQFVLYLKNIVNIQIWQYQPIHNVFLLILNEFGIFVFLLFLFFLYKMFHVEHFKIRDNLLKDAYFKAILVSFIFIMLFDHYFWDIQPGQILLWLTLGFIAGS